MKKIVLIYLAIGFFVAFRQGMAGGSLPLGLVIQNQYLRQLWAIVGWPFVLLKM